MDYKVFLEKAASGVKKKLGNDYEVRVERILKNNSCEYQSILISRKDEGESCMVAPAIRMDCWYELYKEGFGIDNIVSEVIDAYKAGMKDAEGVRKVAYAGNDAESHVFCRLINAERNREILKKSPHILMEDLAVTFHYMCSNDGEMLQSFRVTDSVMKDWNVTKDELYDYAMKNTPVLFPEKFMSMRNIMEEYADFGGEAGLEQYTADDSGDEVPMYVLTNETGFNGATVILYSRNMKKIARKYNCNMYILPSSIHEVILIPQLCEPDCERLSDLVKDVNRNHVDVMEQLSDSVYLYNMQDESITVCG